MRDVSGWMKLWEALSVGVEEKLKFLLMIALGFRKPLELDFSLLQNYLNGDPPYKNQKGSHLLQPLM